MTTRHMAQAWEVEMESAALKAVLVYLASRANSKGHAWPSTGTIARHTSMSRRHVMRALEDLAKLGHISKASTFRPRNSRGRPVAIWAVNVTPGHIIGGGIM